MNQPISPPIDYDIGAIKAGNEWPERPLPVSARIPGSYVVMRRSVLNEIHAHGRSSDDEICGVLIGNVCRDGENPFVHIEASIRGNYAAGKSTQVTFTAETWTHIQNVLERDHPDKRILGWYHTHPGHGIFLSEMDLFIHRNFFNLPWHTAFVYDPKQNQEGLFVWRGGELIAEKFMVEENDTGGSVPASASTQMTAAAAPPGTVMELSARIQSLEQKQKWLLAGLAICAMLAIAWPLLVSAVLPAIKSQFLAPFSHPAPRQQPEAPKPGEKPGEPAKFVAPDFGAIFPSANFTPEAPNERIRI